MRIGVYTCHCGLNIAGTLDVKEIASKVSGIQDVIISRDILFACSDTGQNSIEGDIKAHSLDRIVIAACTPRLHEKTFRNLMERAGLNPYLLEIVNIREQCSWVHKDHPPAATKKAIDLIRVGVARARLLEALDIQTYDVVKSALVIGGGIAGIQAALDMADAGIEVHLVEKEPTIGSMMARLNEVFPTNDCTICVLAPKMTDVANHPLITLHTYSEVTDITGHAGQFTATINKKARFVDEEKCKGCIEDCAAVCPVQVSNKYSFGIKKRKAIYIPIPQAIPLKVAKKVSSYSALAQGMPQWATSTAPRYAACQP